MCILLNVKKHEKTFALNVDIFKVKEKYIKYLKNKVGRSKIVTLHERTMEKSKGGQTCINSDKNI